MRCGCGRVQSSRFFFFQAGDGIRDPLVTGVQTCALPILPELPLFSFTKRGCIHEATISQTFHTLLPKLQLRIPPGVSPPRLHDLRHSFAVATLLRWYRQGIDPNCRLIQLSTFLGHVDPNSTAVYLTITEELLHHAARRFQVRAPKGGVR